MIDAINLALGVLDHQIVDSEDFRCGKVDELDAPESGDRIRTHDLIAWSSVVRADRRGIVVRDGTSVR